MENHPGPAQLPGQPDVDENIFMNVFQMAAAVRCCRGGARRKRGAPHGAPHPSSPQNVGQASRAARVPTAATMPDMMRSSLSQLLAVSVGAGYGLDINGIMARSLSRRSIALLQSHRTRHPSLGEVERQIDSALREMLRPPPSHVICTMDVDRVRQLAKERIVDDFSRRRFPLREHLLTGWVLRHAAPRAGRDVVDKICEHIR